MKLRGVSLAAGLSLLALSLWGQIRRGCGKSFYTAPTPAPPPHHLALTLKSLFVPFTLLSPGPWPGQDVPSASGKKHYLQRQLTCFSSSRERFKCLLSCGQLLWGQEQDLGRRTHVNRSLGLWIFKTFPLLSTLEGFPTCRVSFHQLCLNHTLFQLCRQFTILIFKIQPHLCVVVP